METKNTILLELEQISPAVANLNKVNLFTLPTGYFEELPTLIVAQIKSETFLNEAKAPAYAAPNGYFTNLAETILQKAKQESYAADEVFNEMENIAPLLNTISKKNIYLVPLGYFEELLIEANPRETAKIISFGKWKKISRCIAAAVFTGIVALGGMRYFATAKVADFNKEIAKTSDEELKQILENQPSTTVAVTNYLEEEHQDASIFEATNDEELKQFLSEQAETAEKLNKDI